MRCVAGNKGLELQASEAGALQRTSHHLPPQALRFRAAFIAPFTAGVRSQLPFRWRDARTKSRSHRAGNNISPPAAEPDFMLGLVPRARHQAVER